MMKFATTLAATFCLATAASGQEYSCVMDQSGTGGWIRPVIQVKVDEASGAAWVRDDLTNRTVKGWHDAKLSVNNKKRYTVTWTYKDDTKDSRNQSTPALDYRLTIVKASMKANASMDPRGYDNRFSGRGKCKPTK